VRVRESDSKYMCVHACECETETERVRTCERVPARVCVYVKVIVSTCVCMHVSACEMREMCETSAFANFSSHLLFSCANSFSKICTRVWLCENCSFSTVTYDRAKARARASARARVNTATKHECTLWRCANDCNKSRKLWLVNIYPDIYTCMHACIYTYIFMYIYVYY